MLRGYSGYNLAWAQHLVHKVFPPDAAVKPALVTVFFGANDAALAGGVRFEPVHFAKNVHSGHICRCADVEAKKRAH